MHIQYKLPMPIEISRKQVDGIDIVAPKGRLKIGPPVEALRNTFDDLLASGRKRIVVDLTDVDYIDSSALGCLVVAHSKFEQVEGSVILFGLSERNVELLVITKLATVFRTAPSELDAINMSYPERGTGKRGFDILNFVQEQTGKKDEPQQ